MKNNYRGWEYAKYGDYHRNLDPNWSYAPTYYSKMNDVRKFIDSLPKDAKILDAGCGEGVLVEEYKKSGRDITGIDLNYESESVTCGNILSMPFEDNKFDAILLLDVFEHISFADTKKALNELKRILKDNGFLYLTVPNLANLYSRITMFFRGDLYRSDCVENHVSERPLRENMRILSENGFEIKKVAGITLTVPYLYTRLIHNNPAKYLWLHNLLDKITLPGLSLLNILVCRVKK